VPRLARFRMPHQAQRRVALQATATATTVAVAAAASEEQPATKSQAAPPNLEPSLILNEAGWAAALATSGADKAKDAALVVSKSAIQSAEQELGDILRDLGNGWVTVDTRDEIGKMLGMGAELAAVPEVQQAASRVMRKHGDAALTLRLMSEQLPTATRASTQVPTHGEHRLPPAGSLSLSSGSFRDAVFLSTTGSMQSLPALSVVSAQSLPLPLSSMVSECAFGEADANRAFLYRHAVTLQAGVRCMLAARNAERRAAEVRTVLPRLAADVLLSHLPTRPYVHLTITLCAKCERPCEVSIDLDVRYERLCAVNVDEAKAKASPLPHRKPASPSSTIETLSTVALVMGLLAVVLTRNPQAARSATASAAAVIAALCICARSTCNL